jgi:hypothetical protein
MVFILFLAWLADHWLLGSLMLLVAAMCALSISRSIAVLLLAVAYRISRRPEPVPK